MSALILGDPHLGKIQFGKIGIGSNLNSRVVDQINLLDWTLDQAITHSVSNIIITGDIFDDPKPTSNLITLMISWLKKCQSNQINVHIISGNHDILRNGFISISPLDIISEMDMDHIFIHKDMNTVIIDTTAFTFLPFRDRKSFLTSSNAEALDLIKNSLLYELNSIPPTYTKVVVGHLALEGSIHIGDEIDDLANELFCPLSMFNGYDYVWMGHVHKPQVLCKSPYIAHIGSMDVSNFGETDHKKHIVIFDTINSSFITEILPTRTLKKMILSVPKDVDSTEFVISELKKENWDQSIAKIEVTLSDPSLKSINKSTIEKFMSSQGAFYIAGISESKKISLLKKDKSKNINTETDLISAIKMWGEKHYQSETKEKFINLAIDIYNLYRTENS